MRLLIDVFRYIILYHFGGLYADMDYECVRDFWHMLKSGKASVAESVYRDARKQLCNVDRLAEVALFTASHSLMVCRFKD
jgi:hypothetical protein